MNAKKGRYYEQNEWNYTQKKENYYLTKTQQTNTYEKDLYHLKKKPIKVIILQMQMRKRDRKIHIIIDTKKYIMINI